MRTRIVTDAVIAENRNGARSPVAACHRLISTFNHTLALTTNCLFSPSRLTGERRWEIPWSGQSSVAIPK
jgi:hypothetical protein